MPHEKSTVSIRDLAYWHHLDRARCTVFFASLDFVFREGLCQLRLGHYPRVPMPVHIERCSHYAQNLCQTALCAAMYLIYCFTLVWLSEQRWFSIPVVRVLSVGFSSVICFGRLYVHTRAQSVRLICILLARIERRFVGLT